jgi:predicted small metal-binding protein
MLKFKCQDTFFNLPPEAAKHVINPAADCRFEAVAATKVDLIKKIVEHATEVHGLEDRRLAPAVLMDRVESHIFKED